MSKPRIVKDFEKVDEDVIALIKLKYPRGFEKHLVQFKNHKGEFISALPFETDSHYYLIRMTRKDAEEIINEDEDYDDDGNLTDEAKDRLEDQLEEISDGDED